ncbi:TPA: hypothetical protein ACGAEL_003204 [Legionella pneumophila]|uniref:hypothetical protein n=1 Tax=Legionella pneumophila TaxID=446 RepID=UPI0005A61EAF|nr:hypothetical protein [Legionella pneumophila]HAT8853968.1 hypothetical protein [Legionella pneumophila subsp. pneumophila]HAT7074308.1 hypothetical protein [Legionella pneumophila]HAT8623693.1 hypothetical protein [Legionella pneumophila]HAT8643196.1 hypothetical protein [Legionella pneumophila]HAT8869598.1 hypothetical protein [Legionella pneumophila subsp. pneumophila]
MADVTMELAKESFSQWRSNRNNQAEPIPEKLWGMALGLYPKYKRSTICEQLHLSGSGFKRRLEEGLPAFSDKGFVLASKSGVKKMPKQGKEIQLTIQGKERALTIHVEAGELSKVIPHIGALL